ncbi:MAG: hypothetical protein J6P38_05410 [Acetobacter sp.]|nr:hypothetical protein [Acetobacter sp.]
MRQEEENIGFNVLSVLSVPKKAFKKIKRKIKEKIREKKRIKRLKSYHTRYRIKIKALKKVSEKKIKVVFLVTLDNRFSAKPLFEKMLNDDLFDPFILVIPTVSWGEKFHMMERAYERFVGLYGKSYVLNSYDDHQKTFIDYSSGVDIAVFDTPYETSETYEQYTITYYAEKQILPIYISYGLCPDGVWGRDHIMTLESLALCWKVFVETKDNFDDFCQYSIMKGRNAVLSGYCKIDDLAKVEKKKSERKKIILAPHHTVMASYLPLSNFLAYHDFFLELPQKYPQIDWVFRPHPRFIAVLSGDTLYDKPVEGWGKERVEAYIKKISSFPNVEYQEGGDYFETFVNSNAIIHDCGSFMMEYLYTGHPCLYLLKNKQAIREVFASIGQKCLEHYYQAFNTQDIIDFIDNVVLKENDPMKDRRIKFAKEEIMVNYPHVADFILNDIKGELT